MNWPTHDLPTIGQSASLACVLEASAHKPGNVHRGADFENMTYVDMIASAVAIGPWMQSAHELGVGATIKRAVQATQSAVAKNTNLGTVLLLGPLAVAARNDDLRRGVRDCLAHLAPRDARDVYDAIRLAQPAGLGTTPEADVNQEEPPDDLRAAMRLAADHDLVARQYAYDFEEVFEFVLPAIERHVQCGGHLLDSIVQAHIETLAQFPDSLIWRKCGRQVADQASLRARRILDAGGYGDEAYQAELAELDFWLRADGNRRNPGTTADLIAAALFVGLRQQRFDSSMP